MRADYQGSIPVPTRRRFAGSRLRLNRNPLARSPIEPHQATVLKLGINDVWVFGINFALEAVAADNDVPIRVGNAVNAGRTGRAAERAVVLRSAINLVKRRVRLLASHIIKLCDGKVGDVSPIGGSIKALINAAVTTCEVIVGMFGIDPQRVKIDMCPAGPE